MFLLIELELLWRSLVGVDGTVSQVSSCERQDQRLSVPLGTEEKSRAGTVGGTDI